MSQEVRLAVQRALDKLIGRFGTTGEVIHELRVALKALDKEVPASSGKDAASNQDEGAATPPAPVEAEEEKAEPRPTARKSMGRKR